MLDQSACEQFEELSAPAVFVIWHRDFAFGPDRGLTI
jgi:hypothetical protein